MSQAIVTTSTEDGYIVNSPLAVFKTQNDVVLSASDSVQTIIGEGYFFFDTRDAVTGLPANAIIDSILFTYFISAWSFTPNLDGFQVFSCDNACIGSTLETADFQGVTQHLEENPQPMSTGFNTSPITSINRNGITNVRAMVSSGGASIFMNIDAREKPGGHPATLTIFYHVPVTVRLGGYTSYDIGRFDVSQPIAERLPEEAAAIARGDRRYMRQE